MNGPVNSFYKSRAIFEGFTFFFCEKKKDKKHLMFFFHSNSNLLNQELGEIKVLNTDTAQYFFFKWNIHDTRSVGVLLTVKVCDANEDSSRFLGKPHSHP